MVGMVCGVCRIYSQPYMLGVRTSTRNMNKRLAERLLSVMDSPALYPCNYCLQMQRKKSRKAECKTTWFMIWITFAHEGCVMTLGMGNYLMTMIFKLAIMVIVSAFNDHITIILCNQLKVVTAVTINAFTRGFITEKFIIAIIVVLSWQ